MTFRTIVLVAICLVCGLSAALAENCFDYSLSTHFVNRLSVTSPGEGTQGTDLRSMDVAWPYAFAGGYPLGFGSPTFYALDISDQADPRVVGSIVGSLGSAWDLEVHGDLVFVIGGGLFGGTGALSVVDVSNPMVPAKRWLREFILRRFRPRTALI